MQTAYHRWIVISHTAGAKPPPSGHSSRNRMTLTEEQRRVHQRWAIFVLLGVVGLLAVLVLVYVFTLGRSPLAGPSSHDFGVVHIEGRSSQVSHTFTLANRTRSPIAIGEVTHSCGCTSSEPSTNLVQPGETLEITATLSLATPGRRSSEIRLHMEGLGVHTLEVSGIGRPIHRLRTRDDSLRLNPGQMRQIQFFADIWPDEWPNYQAVPQPTIETPDGVEATLEQWHLRRQPDRARSIPAIWRGALHVTLHDDALPNDAVLTLRLPTQDESLDEAHFTLHIALQAQPSE